MPKLLPLLALGGAAYWAHQNGYLDMLLSGSDPVPDAAKANSESPFTGSAPKKAGASRWEQMLLDHQSVLQPWALKNLKWTAAICMTENRGMNPKARGSAGELGVMQVKPGTANDMAEWGYATMLPTAGVLKTTAGGLHFGTSYLQYLSTLSADRDWITMAYNGGPGFEKLGANYIALRAAYLNKVVKNYKSIGGLV